MDSNSKKYGRTYHFPWSPGVGSDDKIIESLDQFLGKEVVITEKLDGSNSCLVPEDVFARSHATGARHISFSRLKAKHQEIAHLLKSEEMVFGENCMAVHSIVYDLLPSFFFMFGLYNKETKTWGSWDEVKKRAEELDLLTVPELGVYTFKNLKEMQKTVEEICKEKSIYGGSREGVVMRLRSSFHDDEFSKSLVKNVRANHVQTDHWTKSSMIPQKIQK